MPLNCTPNTRENIFKLQEKDRNMAVPKKRTSKAAKGQRRSHDALKAEQLVTEPTSGLVIPRRFYRAAQKGVARLAGKR